MTCATAVAGIEIPGDFDSPHSVIVDVAGFDVRGSGRLDEGEGDDVGERRLSSMQGAKCIVHYRACAIRINELANV